MREDIYWVGAFKVKPEQFDDFRQVVAPLVAATKQGRERSRMSATSAKIAPQSIFLSTIEFPTLSYRTFSRLSRSLPTGFKFLLPSTVLSCMALLNGRLARSLTALERFT
jgi:hypothetical protein